MKPETAVVVLEVLGATSAIAVALRGLIPALKAWAAHTASKRDDEVVSKLEVGLDWLIQACDVVRRVLPRVVIGPLPSTQPIATTIAPAASASVAVPPMKPLSVPPPIGKEPKA